MDWTTFGSMLARHLLTKSAGILITHGIMKDDPSSTEALVGAGMFFVGLAWSAWQKYGQVLVDKRKAQLSTLNPDALKSP